MLLPGGNHARGVTLIEMLVVLSIIITLSGLSLAGYYAWRNQTFKQSAFTEVALQLRVARNYAIKGAVGSVVEVDPYAGVLNSWSFRPVDRLSFENTGQLKKQGNVEVDRNAGRLGAGARFAGGELLLPHAGGFVGRDGMAVRFYVNLRGRPSYDEDWVLFRGGKLLRVSLSAELSLTVMLGGYSASSRGRVLVPGKWHEVMLRWVSVGDADEIELFVDGMALAMRNRAAEESLLAEIKAEEREKEPEVQTDDPDSASEEDPDAPKVVPSLFPEGFAFGPFHGDLDEAVLLTVIAGKEFGFSGDLYFVGKKQRIYFGPSGGLDLRYHDKPVAIGIAEKVQELKPLGRTYVASEKETREVFPDGPVNYAHVEVTGRIWFERAELPEEEGEVDGSESGTDDRDTNAMLDETKEQTGK